MKKFLILLVALALTLTLAGCTKEVIKEVEVEVEVEVIVEVPIELDDIPTDLDMVDIDDFLGRPDVQYVDLRNFDDKLNSGYIAGFEFIPFFDYLEATDILVRTDGDWTFAAADIVSEASLRALFNEDKTIFLMCGSGTRAGYVLAALEELGYTDVINVGGIGSYEGDNLVAGDGEYHIEVQLVLPSVVDMDNIDDFLGRSDVQYVDLRNFDDKMKSGYIAGFEFIPFFDYLEATGILVRTDGDWTFATEDIGSTGALNALFDADKTIFLMCGSGTRAGYVMAALEDLGYTDVINVGGIGSYAGDNLVAGDGEYRNEISVLGPYTPGVYFGYDPVGKYNATIVIGQAGGITEVFFDATYGDSTKQALGFDYHMKLYSGGDYEWFEHANMLSDFIVANQGWDGITLIETLIDPEWNALTVPHHFINIDTDNSPDGVAGVSIGAEGFVLAWNAAIAQATDAGTEGLVVITGTPAAWAEAHAPYVQYVDGQYYGYSDGRSAYITIENGQIVDVYLDALHGVDTDADTIKDLWNSKRSYEIEDYTMNYTLNDNGTPGDDTDDFYELDTDKLDWWMQADAVQDAIIDAQEWAWVLVDGDFDVDGVTGVSIGVADWQIAVEEALLEALAPMSVAEANALADTDLVKVEGVITAILEDGTFTMEDADGTALYVDDYDAVLTWEDVVVAVGDEVLVIALRSDYNDLNLIDTVSSVVVLSSGNDITAAIVVTDMATFRTNATIDDFGKRYVFTNVEILETGYYNYFFEPTENIDRMGILTDYSDPTIVFTAGDFVTFTAVWYGTNGVITDDSKIFRFSVGDAADYVIVTPAP